MFDNRHRLVLKPMHAAYFIRSQLNERLVTLRDEVKSKAYHRAKTDQEREANPELTDFEKQNARRKLKGATLLLRHASALGGEETSSVEKDGDESTNSDGNSEGDESVVVTDPNAEVRDHAVRPD